MNPLVLGALFKGGSALLNLFGNKKKAKAQDAYANTAGQNDVNYANAQTTYNTGIQNQQAQKDERSRRARAALKTSLLRSIGPNIIGQDALPALEDNATYAPIDYSGAPQRVYTPRPSSSTGSTYDFLSQGLDAVAQGQIGQAQADQYQKELDAYRQALANPGVATLPTSNVNYSKILQRVFGGK